MFGLEHSGPSFGLRASGDCYQPFAKSIIRDQLTCEFGGEEFELQVQIPFVIIQNGFHGVGVRQDPKSKVGGWLNAQEKASIL